jgi:hypothetical protein
MAGRYWYLEENRTEEMEQAVEAFEKSCNRSPFMIWHCLKFRGNLENLPPPARRKIEDLIEECRRQGMYPKMKDGATVWRATTTQNAKSIGFCAGIVILMALTAYLSLVGLVTLIKEWFK